MNNYDFVRELVKNNDYITLEGTVTKIIFQNEDNGFCVCEMETEDELVVVAGTMPFLTEGESITVLGNYIVHQTFGRQFKAEYYEKKLPSSIKSIQKYLSSGMIRGIGKITAKRIVEKFGEDTFNVLENNPEWLTDVKGITQKKAAEISAEFRNQFGFKNVVTFCSSYFSVPTAIRIYKELGTGAVDRIKQNPYILCDNITGINFEHADKLADSLGYDRTSDERIFAGLKFVISHNSYSEGHLFLPYEKLVSGAAMMLQISENAVEDYLGKAFMLKRLIKKEIGSIDAVYDYNTFQVERYCATRLIEIDRQNNAKYIDEKEILVRLSAIEQNESITYSAEQQDAVISVFKNGIFILTGGPGTGKTTVIKALIGVFSQTGKKIALAAPTGRAAKRMSETTGMEAKTLHRLLEVTYENDTELKFNRDDENPLEFDVIIVDETSMIDIFLLKSLLKAIKKGAKLIFIGDSDQLPSVGAGNVLHDMIDSGLFMTKRLDKIFRQSEESLIIANAHKINSGDMPTLNAKDRDFFFIKCHSADKIAQTVIDLFKNRLPKTYGDDITEKIQVLTPSKKGFSGTVNLNLLLQNELNPADYGKSEKKRPNFILRENDKVMQIKNNYSIEWTQRDGTVGTGIYNGDIGVVKYVDAINEIVNIEFDDKTVEYDFLTLDELIHAYAVTIHKSQGSEYPVVLLPISKEVPKLLTRNLLYTAVTRAQKMLILIGSEDTVEYMVKNNRQAVRYTGLSQLLTEENKY